MSCLQAIPPRFESENIHYSQRQLQNSRLLWHNSDECREVEKCSVMFSAQVNFCLFIFFQPSFWFLFKDCKQQETMVICTPCVPLQFVYDNLLKQFDRLKTELPQTTMTHLQYITLNRSTSLVYNRAQRIKLIPFKLC